MPKTYPSHEFPLQDPLPEELISSDPEILSPPYSDLNDAVTILSNTVLRLNHRLIILEKELKNQPCIDRCCCN